MTTEGLLVMPTSRIIEIHPEIQLLVSILDLIIPNCQMGDKLLWCVVKIKLDICYDVYNAPAPHPMLTELAYVRYTK